MACGAEVYMEEDYSEQNIYFIINHGELDWIFFAFPWQLHARVLQKCYSSLSKKKKNLPNNRSFEHMKPNQMQQDASSNSMKFPIV